MTRLTIAIPTWNRDRNLEVALASIAKLVVPKNLELIVAVSNSESDDGTGKLLRSASIPNGKLVVNNMRITGLHNWIALSKIVPEESDFVWLHGDDDIIFDPDALIKIAGLGLFDAPKSIDIISIPQSKRLSGKGDVFEGTLGEASCLFGAHEVLGWMSQLILTAGVYFELSARMALFIGKPYDVESLHAHGIGNFTHSTIILREFWERKTVLVNLAIIDEQVNNIDKRITFIERRNLEFPQKFLFSDRFFYDARHLGAIATVKAGSVPSIFYRYVTKSFIDLLLDIIMEDIKTGEEIRKIPIIQKMKNLSCLVETLDDPCLKRDLTSLLSAFEIDTLNQNISVENNRLLDAKGRISAIAYKFEVL